MELTALVFLLIALLASGAVYGTDVFCALVQRPALSRVDDRTLGQTVGFVHLYGDRRMPIVGVVGTVSTVLAGVAAVLAESSAAAVLVGMALAAVIVWLTIFARVSAPINRTMTSAALAGGVAEGIRELQARWDRVITVRAVLQGSRPRRRRLRPVIEPPAPAPAPPTATATATPNIVQRAALRRWR